MTHNRFPLMRALALDPGDERLSFFESCMEEVGFGAMMRAKNTEAARDLLYFNPAQIIVMGAFQKPWSAERFIGRVIAESRIAPAIIAVGDGEVANRGDMLKAGARAVLSSPISRFALTRAIVSAGAHLTLPTAPQAAHRRAARLNLI